MDMTRDFLNGIIDLAPVKIYEANGLNYSSKPLHPIFPPSAETLAVGTLSGLMEFYEASEIETDRLLLHIVSPTWVRLLSRLDGATKRRECYVNAELSDPGFAFGSWCDAERFNIALQTQFLDSANRKALLAIVGNVREEQVKTSIDDGISQSVMARKGIAAVSEIKLPNPVALQPYRTFLEIEQPLSLFVLRARVGPEFALYEAEGAQWQRQAIGDIKEWLKTNLPDIPIIG